MRPPDPPRTSSRIPTTPLACLAAFAAAGVWASAGNHAAAPEDDDADIALIDMTAVFKNYDAFNAARDDLREEIEAESGEVSRLAKKIKELAAELKRLGEGAEGADWTTRNLESAKKEYKQARKDLAARFARKEAELYEELYEEVRLVVADVCGERGIRLVVRHRGEPEDGDEPREPADILKGMNRLIIFSDLPDLSEEVVDRLNDG